MCRYILFACLQLFLRALNCASPIWLESKRSGRRNCVSVPVYMFYCFFKIKETRICLSAWCRGWFTHLLQQKHKSHIAVKPIELKLGIIKTISWRQTLQSCTAILKGEYTQVKDAFLAEQPCSVDLIKIHRYYYVIWTRILLQKLLSNKLCVMVSQPLFSAQVALWLWWLSKEINELMDIQDFFQVWIWLRKVLVWLRGKFTKKERKKNLHSPRKGTVNENRKVKSSEKSQENACLFFLF